MPPLRCMSMPPHSLCVSRNSNHVSANLKPGAAGPDNSAYVCPEAISALHQAAPALPNLKELTLWDSPVLGFKRDVDELVSMLAAFSPSLTRLGVDVWPAITQFGSTFTVYNTVAEIQRRQAQVFGVISRMKRLQTLSIRDWDVLTDKCEQTLINGVCPWQPLRKLPQLAEVRVGGFPCTSEACKHGPPSARTCINHPGCLPFRPHGVKFVTPAADEHGRAEGRGGSECEVE